MEEGSEGVGYGRQRAVAEGPVAQLQRKYASKSTAKDFVPQEPNVEFSSLPRELEKQESLMRHMQHVWGANGAAVAKLELSLREMHGEETKFFSDMAKFKLTSEMANDLGKAKEALLEFAAESTGKADTLVKQLYELRETAKDALKLAGAGFSKALLARRKLYVERKSDLYRRKVEKEQPSAEYLFGENLGTVLKAIRDGTKDKGRSHSWEYEGGSRHGKDFGLPYAYSR